MPVFWIVFHLAVIGVLVLDLWVFNRDTHELSAREAVAWTVLWILLTCGFDAGVYFRRGAGQPIAFMAGYLIELSLSIDNLFIFLALFASLSVPRAYLHGKSAVPVPAEET